MAATGGRFAGRTALVTGAATGIGRAVAVRLAEEGAAVAVNHPPGAGAAATETLAAAEAASRAAGAGATRHLAVEADVADEAAVERMFEGLDAAWGGRLDVLVLNAGILAGAPSHELAAGGFDRVMAVNFRGAFLCARAGLARMRAAGRGAIVAVTSVHETIPKPGYAAYQASKAALAGLVRTLALEYAGAGIRVNAVGPGAIETPMNAGWTGDAAARAAVEAHIPMGRAGAPAEIAAVVAFLASDEASYVTGQTLFACGGLSLFADFREDWSSRAR